MLPAFNPVILIFLRDVHLSLRYGEVYLNSRVETHSLGGEIGVSFAIKCHHMFICSRNLGLTLVLIFVLGN